MYAVGKQNSDKSVTTQVTSTAHTVVSMGCTMSRFDDSDSIPLATLEAGTAVLAPSNSASLAAPATAADSKHGAVVSMAELRAMAIVDRTYLAVDTHAEPHSLVVVAILSAANATLIARSSGVTHVFSTAISPSPSTGSIGITGSVQAAGATRIHWCDVHRSTDKSRAIEVCHLPLAKTATAALPVVDHDRPVPRALASAIQASGALSELVRGRSNVEVCGVAYEKDALLKANPKLLLRIGVTAKGYIPVGEETLPPHIDVSVPMDAYGTSPDALVVLRLTVDVCRGWCM